MWPQFHISKYCFKDCMHAASYVRQDKILQEKVVEFKIYMQTVQEEDWFVRPEHSHIRPKGKPPYKEPWHENNSFIYQAMGSHKSTQQQPQCAPQSTACPLQNNKAQGKT
eukprot:15365127-Ditylum_brightwellii.AAC.2